eukprot:CAMPEP_0172596808 /NCGR_PEP_ID=MMETSP1068-20121228/16652_1 /TAXON_ID=35684 /ORGANISM="Pseudopedinella elastica, Strain CCMP716" /LENGTH=335 /DNA_ID=CAMNT_0013396003 /DNA_START=8 /DNA_END=1018 /DNA_ORIENTATION=+
MSSDLVVVVTGANQGVGFDACRQFALAPRVAKVVLTFRSPDKANRAIEALATATGKDKSLFDFVVLDLDSRDSATKAVDALPAKIDRLVLNAGAVTAGVKNGVTATFSSTVGHGILTEGLLEAGKLQPGARVLYAHSEVSRWIPAFTGLQPCCMSIKPGQYLYSKVTVGRKCLPPCFCLPATNQLGTYGYTKIVGGLFFSQLATEQPGVYFINVSPGGVFTNIYQDFPWPGGCFIRAVSCLMVPLRIMHPVDVGAKRYVDAMLVEDFPSKFESGAVLGSPCGCCYYGAMGPLTDQTKLGCCASAPYLKDPALMADAAAKVREFGQIPGAKAIERG